MTCARGTYVNIGMWNMLASNLAQGEFMSRSDEPFLWWETRRDKVINVIQEMLDKCDAVVVIENDRPLDILRGLQRVSKHIRGVAVIDGDNVKKPSMSAQLGMSTTDNADLNALYNEHKIEHDISKLKRSAADYPEAKGCYQNVHDKTRQRVKDALIKTATDPKSLLCKSCAEYKICNSKGNIKFNDHG